MKKHWVLICFSIIFVIALGFRFYQFGKIPVSLYWDEVAVGYNAYSIATNLHDEHGILLPLMFRSFGEYKMPAYIYLTAPVVKIFGMNEISVRLWSGILGMIAVVGSYLLTHELLIVTKLRKKISLVHIQSIALLTMFLMAISQWHVHFSRIGFEANGLLTCMIIGFWLFMRGLHTKYSLFFSAIVLGIGMYFYRGVIGFLPFISLVAVILFYKQLFQKEKIKTTIIAGIIFLIIATPITIELFSSRGLERTNEVSIFNLKNSEHVEEIVKKQTESPNPFNKIIFNRRVGYGLDFLTGYASHLGPQYLFFQGDTNPRHNGANSGVLYIWTIPFILVGFIMLWQYSRKIFSFVICWILAGPIPAALSTPVPHALRSLNMLPMPDFVTAIGLIGVCLVIKKKYRPIFIGGMSLVIIYFLSTYLHYYYSTWPAHSAESWGDGHKQMIQYVIKNQQKYVKVVISGHYWQPYIYTLFYTSYDPISYQHSGSNRQFGKYLFGGTSWDHDQYDQELDVVDLEKFAGTKNMLVVLSPYEYEKQKVNLHKIIEIKDASGQTVFVISQHL